VFGVNVPLGVKINTVAPFTSLGLSTPAIAGNTGLTFNVTSNLALDGTTSNGSPIVTVASTSGIIPEMTVTGTNIPAGTKVLAVTSPTTFTLTANASGTTSTLSLSPLTPALTNTLNNTSVVGVLGGYITINKAIWAQSGLAGTGLAIVPSTNQVSTLATGAWNNVTANVNLNLDVASSITGAGNIGQLTFNTPAANTVTLNGPSIIRTGGILVTENVGANTSRISASVGNVVSVLNCVTTAGSATVNCSSTAGLLVNMAISGATIPTGSRVASLVSATQFTLASGTGVTAGTGNFTAGIITSLSGVATTVDSSGNLTTTLTAPSTSFLIVGMTVSGVPNIPAGTIVTTIPTTTHSPSATRLPLQGRE
jgi:hypothetical protein